MLMAFKIVFLVFWFLDEPTINHQWNFSLSSILKIFNLDDQVSGFPRKEGRVLENMDSGSHTQYSKLE